MKSQIKIEIMRQGNEQLYVGSHSSFSEDFIISPAVGDLLFHNSWVALNPNKSFFGRSGFLRVLIDAEEAWLLLLDCPKIFVSVDTLTKRKSTRTRSSLGFALSSASITARQLTSCFISAYIMRTTQTLLRSHQTHSLFSFVSAPTCEGFKLTRKFECNPRPITTRVKSKLTATSAGVALNYEQVEMTNRLKTYAPGLLSTLHVDT